MQKMKVTDTMVSAGMKGYYQAWPKTEPGSNRDAVEFSVRAILEHALCEAETRDEFLHLGPCSRCGRLAELAE